MIRWILGLLQVSRVIVSEPGDETKKSKKRKRHESEVPTTAEGGTIEEAPMGGSSKKTKKKKPRKEGLIKHRSLLDDQDESQDRDADRRSRSDEAPNLVLEEEL